MTAIISKNNISVSNCIIYSKTVECINDIINGKQYDRVCIIKFDMYPVEEIADAIKLLSHVKKVILTVTKGCRITEMLRQHGFYVSELLDDDLVVSADDLEFIEITASIEKTETTVLGSLTDNIVKLRKSIQEIEKYIRGNIGADAVSEETKELIPQSELILTSALKFLYKYNQDNSASTKYLSGSLFKYHEENLNLKEFNKQLTLKVNELSEKFNTIKTDYDVLKKHTVFSYYSAVPVTKSKTESKVLFVREYSYCPFITSFLFNMRLVFTNKKNKGAFIVGQNINDNVKEKFKKHTVEDINKYKLEEKNPATEELILMGENDTQLWDIIFNCGLNFIIVLDRFYNKEPMLNVNPDCGLNLAAIGSKYDIDFYNLNRENCITSIDTSRGSRYVIPLLNLENLTVKQKAIEYTNGCHNLYKEIAKRMGLRNV